MFKFFWLTNEINKNNSTLITDSKINQTHDETHQVIHIISKNLSISHENKFFNVSLLNVIVIILEH